MMVYRVQSTEPASENTRSSSPLALSWLSSRSCSRDRETAYLSLLSPSSVSQGVDAQPAEPTVPKETIRFE